uniref:ATP synthase subunit a n=1 Tax=Botryllus schlosseri TaxID=30301 RepID=A0A024GW72_BOTSH|nr:ATPase subunit 6 [Botryllus schlosseri]
MFLSFESSVFMGVPMGFFIVLLLLVFMTKILSFFDYKYLINLLSYHFYSFFFPGSLMLIVLFFFIMFMNVYGLIPGTFSLSSLPLMSLGMGLIMWGGGYVYCLSKNYNGCISHFLPQGAPMFLGVLLVWIEILSWIFRPLSLGIRLMANITAGHLLMFLCGSGVFFSGSFFPLVVVFLLALAVLEVGVSFIQSYVYQLLLSLYMMEGLE